MINHINTQLYMRKAIFCCLFMLTTMLSLSAEHLSFKGIPLEGSIYSFCQKLQASGFKLVSRDTNMRILEGKFTKYDVTVGVLSDQTGKNVTSVIVLLPSSEEWKTLVNTYDYYKSLYTEKYGEPALCEENNPSKSDSNISLMYEVHQGTISYGSVFLAPGGYIELSIEKANGLYTGQVIIRYMDEQNFKENRKSELDEI